MMEMLKAAFTFALAGVMLGIMLISTVATLMLIIAIYDMGHKAIVKWRADRRYKRAKKQMEEQSLRVIRHGREE